MEISSPNEAHASAWNTLDEGESLDFEQLYRDERAFRYVWVTLRRLGVATHLLEDATHDVFVVVLRRCHDFRGDAKVSTWLFGIARRIAHRYRRTAARRARRLERLASDPCAPSGASHEELERLEARHALRAFLARLDSDALELFVICELEDRTTREAAEILGRNPHTLARHRRNLRNATLPIPQRQSNRGPLAPG